MNLSYDLPYINNLEKYAVILYYFFPEMYYVKIMGEGGLILSFLREL